MDWMDWMDYGSFPKIPCVVFNAAVRKTGMMNLWNDMGIGNSNVSLVYISIMSNGKKDIYGMTGDDHFDRDELCHVATLCQLQKSMAIWMKKIMLEHGIR